MALEISKHLTFGELLKEYPAAGRILSSRGLHCIGCHIAVSETIEEGSRVHGLSDAQIDEMIEEIKASI